MPPIVEEVHVLVEDLHAVVRTVGDEQSPAGIVREGVRPPELAGAGALLAVGSNELAVLRIPDQSVTQPVRRPRPMAVGNQDVAVRHAEAGRWSHESIRSG